MELADVARTWDTLGRNDPLGAIIAAPDARRGGWDPEDFFESGRTEIEDVLQRVEKVWGRGIGTTRALDFGCGVGRLTQALARRFDQCDGVDIALSMIDWAERYNRYGERCRYHLNTGDDLGQFEDGVFDLVYTAHTLQHVDRRYATRYVSEFFRVLAPSGVAVIEIVTEPVRGADGPLAAGDYCLEIEVSRVGRLAAGQVAAIGLTAVNRGRGVLPAVGTDGWFQVSVGNHWVSPAGRGRFDDGRVALPHDLGPGESARLVLEVTAPTEPGRYTLEIDGVQEGVAWFADQGNRPARLPVVVTSGSSLADRLRQVAARREPVVPDRELRSARKEMHGWPADEMRDFVASCGATVIDVIDWDEISGTRSHDWQRRGFVCVLG